MFAVEALCDTVTGRKGFQCLVLITVFCTHNVDINSLIFFSSRNADWTNKSIIGTRCCSRRFAFYVIMRRFK